MLRFLVVVRDGRMIGFGLETFEHLEMTIYSSPSGSDQNVRFDPNNILNSHLINI